jgi:hypothetical protein
MLSTIIDHIREGAANSGGGFVRKDLLTRRWFKVGDKHAREKVGQVNNIPTSEYLGVYTVMHITHLFTRRCEMP